MTSLDHRGLRRARPRDGGAQRLQGASSRRTCTSPTATRSTGCTGATASSPTPSSSSPPRRRRSGPTTIRTTRRSPPRRPATGPAILLLIDRAACPYATLGSSYADGRLRGPVRRPRDHPGLDARTPPARTRRPRAAGRSATRPRPSSGGPKQLGRHGLGDPRPGHRGRRRRLRERQRRGRRDHHDPEPRDPRCRRTPPSIGALTFRYAFAHTPRPAADDAFRVLVEAEDGTLTPRLRAGRGSPSTATRPGCRPARRSAPGPARRSTSWSRRSTAAPTTSSRPPSTTSGSAGRTPARPGAPRAGAPLRGNPQRRRATARTTALRVRRPAR